MMWKQTMDTISFVWMHFGHIQSLKEHQQQKPQQRGFRSWQVWHYEHRELYKSCETYNFLKKVQLFVQMAISSTFYEQLYCTNVFCTVLIYLQVGLVISLGKNNGAKAACKMLMLLITGCPCLGFCCWGFTVKVKFSTNCYLVRYCRDFCCRGFWQHQLLFLN